MALAERWGALLPEREPIDRQLTGLPEKRYALYNDPEKIGVTVLERRLSADHARRHRLQWTTNDIGRLRGEIEDELGRSGLDDSDLHLTLSAAVRVGDADRRSHGGKFALVPEVTQATSGLLAAEHEIVVNGLSGVFRDFRYPYDEYVPKMTIGRLYRGTEPESVAACAGELNDLLRDMPLTISLEPIVFFAHQEL